MQYLTRWSLTSYLDHIRTDDSYAILGLITRTNLAPKQPRRDRNEGVRLPPGHPAVSPEALALLEGSNMPSRVQLIDVLFQSLGHRIVSPGSAHRHGF